MPRVRIKFLILKKVIMNENFKRKYTIIRKTSATLELINKDGLSGKIILLPIELIFEWYDEVRKGTFNESTNAKDYRHIIGKQSKYQKHVHGFYNDLGKIALIMKQYSDNHILNEIHQYEIIPVGADWTNREPLLGYPNALEPQNYVLPETGVLQLILRAEGDPNHPYFLILD